MDRAGDVKELRSFGLIVGGIFTVISLWPLLLRGETVRPWALICAAALLLPALVYPKALRPARRVWMAVGHVLGWINTRIILGIIFYALVAPMGMIMRALGKDPMRRRFEPEAETYRLGRQPRPGTHMKHQF